MKLSPDTEKLMILLAQVILADGHIFDSEINALIKGVGELALTDQSGAALSSNFIRRWFKDYLAVLNGSDNQENKENKENKEVALTRVILSLAEWPNKQAVVQTLEAISLSDADFHSEEKLLISIVKAYWQFEGLEAPGATIGV